MITPSFGLTATERVLPSLLIDFTMAVLDSRITLTRALNTATRINASGQIEIVDANLPRFDYNPVTLICNGLLIEPSRKNLLLNTDSLSTQNVTVTAVATTLSFYGTGQVVLSGVHSATVTGTGAYPSRKTYTFTPTAGTLTVTVTGTVQYAQIEAGDFATSYIPNASSQNTRSADVPVMTGTNFSSWYNQTQGAFVLEHSFIGLSSATAVILGINNSANTANKYSLLRVGTTISGGDFVSNNTTTQVDTASLSVSTNTTYKWAFAYKTNSFVFNRNGGAGETNNNCTFSTNYNQLFFTSSTVQCGYMKKLSYWPQRLTNAEVQAFSK